MSPELRLITSKTILRTTLALSTVKARLYQHKRFALLGCGAAALVMAAFALPKGDNTALVHNAPAEVLETLDLTRYDMYLDDQLSGHTISTPDIKHLKIRSGDSLGNLLQDNGLSGAPSLVASI